MSKVGAFDAYVQDEQEKVASIQYQRYVLDTLAECKVPNSFEDWCHDQNCTRDSAHKEEA